MILIFRVAIERTAFVYASGRKFIVRFDMTVGATPSAMRSFA